MMCRDVRWSSNRNATVVATRTQPVEVNLSMDQTSPSPVSSLLIPASDRVGSSSTIWGGWKVPRGNPGTPDDIGASCNGSNETLDDVYEIGKDAELDDAIDSKGDSK